MKFHVLMFYLWTIVVNFIRTLVDFFEFVFNAVGEDACLTSEHELKENEEDTTSSSVFEDEEAAEVYNKSSKVASYLSELEEEEAKIELSAFRDTEEKSCIHCKIVDFCKSPEIPFSTLELGLIDDGEGKNKLTTSEDEGNANVHVKDPDEDCMTPEERSYYEDKETEYRKSNTGFKRNANVHVKDPDEDCMTPEERLYYEDKETECRKSNTGFKKSQTATQVGSLMCNLFRKKLYTDVTFFSNSSEGTISAHRAVLAGKCDYFANLLYGDSEREAVCMEMHVEISNMPFSVFTDIVKYLYTDDIELTDDYTVFEIYAAAESFQIHPLVDRCRIYVDSMEITEENVFSILQLCNRDCVQGLRRRCISYIEKNTFQVISSTDFENCTFDTVRGVCELQCLNLSSEVELLEAVLRWVNVQPSHVAKEFRTALLECIRFLSFTPKEFSDVIQRHDDLLTPEQGLKILIYLNNPSEDNFKSLPEWCSKIHRSFQLEHSDIQKCVLKEHSDRGRIQTLLIPTSEPQNITELICMIHLRCIKGMHRMKRLKFSFEDVTNDGSLLASLLIMVKTSPKGYNILQNHSVNSTQSSFEFSFPVHKGQKVIIKAAAKIKPSCKFLKFRTSYTDTESNFVCYFASKPKGTKLNFISEIEYEALAPRLG